jgi:hypothetical protein
MGWEAGAAPEVAAMRPRIPPRISQQTVSRRTLLEWLGKGTVLALGAPLVEACAGFDAGATTPEDAPGDVPGPGADVVADPTGGIDDAPGAGDAAGESATEALGDGSFPFEPGGSGGGVLDGWGERTVDPQDLRRLLADWRLTVDGMVETPRTFTWDELIALERRDQRTDFHCVEGWSVLDVPWNGVHLSALFDLVRPRTAATHVAFHTVDERYNESLPVGVALEPRTLLAYGIDGRTLPLPHGFPVRIVVPRLLGYKNPKYVRRIELTDVPLLGYWVRAGYPYDGEVPAGRLRPGRY